MLNPDPPIAVRPIVVTEVLTITVREEIRIAEPHITVRGLKTRVVVRTSVVAVRLTHLELNLHVVLWVILWPTIVLPIDPNIAKVSVRGCAGPGRLPFVTVMVQLPVQEVNLVPVAPRAATRKQRTENREQMTENRKPSFVLRQAQDYGRARQKRDRKIYTTS
jgi:hypothetical protein